jgi:hypothetical protein
VVVGNEDSHDVGQRIIGAQYTDGRLVRAIKNFLMRSD